MLSKEDLEWVDNTCGRRLLMQVAATLASPTTFAYPEPELDVALEGALYLARRVYAGWDNEVPF